MRRVFIFQFFFLLQAVVGQSQDFYSIENVGEVRIHFEEENWEHLLDSLKAIGTEKRLWADVKVNDKRYKKTGVRYKGNSSYYSVLDQEKKKLPFNIKLDFKKRKQNLPGGFTTIKLSNVFRDPSFLREVLAYEIASNYMPSPKANFVKLYINDEYFGLYNSTESVDDKFLDKYYGQHEGVFVKCDPDWNALDLTDCPKGDKASLMYLGADSSCYFGFYEMKSQYGWKELIGLTKVLNETPEKIESILDIDQTLWMLAFNNIIVNLDSYTGRLCHNYYMYQDTSGVFHPVIWDMNLAFGGFLYSGIGDRLKFEEMQTLSPFVHYKEKNNKRPLITNLLSNPLYRKVYVAHYKTIYQDYFANSRLRNRAKELHDFIESHVKEDSVKLYSFLSFKQNLYSSVTAGKTNTIGLYELLDERKKYLAKHPLLKRDGPEISNVIHLSYEGELLTVNATIKNTKKTWLCYRYAPFENFKRIEMFDDGGHNDEVVGDDVWGAMIKNEKGIQYYIIAEGEKAATLYPEKASFESVEVGEK
ncbi:MAG: hypothetical protein GY705_05640 [Bacteroidetes bacterium]|nr:hypothetical protein [Bacteroidota bacterium]